MRNLPRSVLAVLSFAGFCAAQSTQGIITGHIRDQLTAAPIEDAVIEYENLDSEAQGSQRSSPDGNYYLPLLSPGSYRVRVSPSLDSASKSHPYQAREVYGVAVPVAGYVQLDFDLRPLSDVWERNRYRSYVFRNNSVVPFFGPDIDPSYLGDFEPNRFVGGQLEPSLSAVIDPRAIASLPLAGRDVYSALVLLPGVAADTATNRSLGLSANGQRPSSSNFLLDGVEENDFLLSGPAIPIVPEMVQEYRVSTNNFSAEYGRTAGYIANAVTQSAISAWHGLLYSDLNNQVLNANTFAHNTAALPRDTLHQIEGGASAGGAIPHSGILTWTSYDYFGSRGFSDPTTYTLPTRAFAESLPQGSLARQLLQDYPPRQWADDSFGLQGPVQFDLPVTLRRNTALERIDYAVNPHQRVMARVAGSELLRPDFNWSPYGEAPFHQQSVGAAASLSSEWRPALVSEVRASYLSNYRSWDLVLPDLPQIVGLGNIQLPGFCCAVDKTQQGWKDRDNTTEVLANFVYSSGANVLKFGGGVLNTRTKTAFKIPSAGEFAFAGLPNFASDNPFLFATSLSSTSLSKGSYEIPDTNRQYRETQPYSFVQEDWRVSSRLTLNGGLRYDRFPSPVNVGAVPDVVVAPGPGDTFTDQIASAHVVQQTGSLFSSRPNNWSVRLAFSLALSPARGTVLRGGFGTFHDRLLDNLYLSASANDLSIDAFTSNSCPVAAFYADRQNTGLLSPCPAQPGSRTLFDLTMFQPKLSSPRLQSFFLSLSQPIGPKLAIELSGMGSRGRNLYATDIVNRQTGFFPPANGLPDIDDRTNQAFSDYAGMSLAVRYRTGRITLNSSYTWSHSIDNQSDPLQGQYFDFGFSNQTDRTGQQYVGAFSLPGDTRIDRGNSDFDQRQNFVGWAVIALPGPASRQWQPLLSNWNVSVVFALRSGLPYSVYAGPNNCFPVCNPRANIVNAADARLSLPVPGGVQLLTPAAFSFPAEGTTGDGGRNTFTGPGFGNLDLSLAKTFSIRHLGEQARLTVRADAFNLFNHANLQNPEANLGSSSANLSSLFGTALYGASAATNGFPSLTPLVSGSRQIHLLLRFQF